MTLNQIQEIIKKNPTTQVYVKWITSSNSTQTARIFRPLKVHQDGSISLEANGYIYYVFPKNIISLDDKKNLPLNFEDWFGSFGNDR